MLELATYLEKANHVTTNRIENVVQINKVDNWVFDKTLSDFLVALQQSHSPFLSTITTEEKIQLPKNLKSAISVISKELKFTQEVEGDIEKLLTKLYVSNPKEHISISKSTEGEFVIFITSNGTYKNVLVDEDGDIQLLIIPQNRSKTYNKMFYKEDGLNFSKVVNTFNEMR